MLLFETFKGARHINKSNFQERSKSSGGLEVTFFGTAAAADIDWEAQGERSSRDFYFLPRRAAASRLQRAGVEALDIMRYRTSVINVLKVLCIGTVSVISS